MIGRVRRTGAVLAVVSCALAGCGGSTPRPSLTPAEAAWADRVNLRAADVPDLSAATIRRPDPVYGPLEAAVERCDRSGTGSGQLAGLGSPRFRSSLEHTNQRGVSVLSLLPMREAASTVYFAPSAAAATRVVAAAASRRGERCIASDYEHSSEMTTEHSKHTEPALANVRVTSSIVSATGQRATRLQITAVDRVFALPTRPSRYTERRLMFTDGRTIVVLSDTGDPQPFPAVDERKLLAILVKRAGERPAP